MTSQLNLNKRANSSSKIQSATQDTLIAKRGNKKNNSIITNNSYQTLLRPHNSTAIVEKSRKISGTDDFLSSALT